MSWCNNVALQTFLEQNEGPGLQHLALKTDNIFHTMRELRQRSSQGGFDFMPRASDAYYECVRPSAVPLLLYPVFPQILCMLHFLMVQLKVLCKGLLRTDLGPAGVCLQRSETH